MGTSLRLILIGIGVVVLLGIFLDGIRRKKQTRHTMPDLADFNSTPTVNDEPDFQFNFDAPSSFEHEQFHGLDTTGQAPRNTFFDGTEDLPIAPENSFGFKPEQTEFEDPFASQFSDDAMQVSPTGTDFQEPKTTMDPFAAPEYAAMQRMTNNPTTTPTQQHDFQARQMPSMQPKQPEPTNMYQQPPAAQPQASPVIAINIFAQEGREFAGYELLQAILSSGLRFGPQGIFHRYENLNGTGPVYFSLASAIAPGTFVMKNMGSTSVPGLTLFMNATEVHNSAAVLELMLTTGQQLARYLNGILLDDERYPLTLERITEYQQLCQQYSTMPA